MFEMFGLDFMVNAFLACLIFGLMLSYLGIHVVGRGIVFVDLALGQISSFGVAMAGYLNTGKLWLPIACTLAGAFLMSLIHVQDRRLKLEAIIGIIYVVTSALTVLVISKTPHGESDIQEVLFGALLAATDREILYLLLVFGLLGLLHFLFRRPIFELTERIESRTEMRVGWRERGWNFFFYMSIGLSIVFAVRLGGVLPVFSYLVVPAVSAVMVARRKWIVVVLAIFNSVVAGLFGLWLSYTFDFPAGPSIVAVFGVIIAGAALLRFVRHRFFNVVFEKAQRLPAEGEAS